MNRYLRIAYIVIVLVGCMSSAECQDVKRVQKITLTVDAKKEKEIQHQVDQGHQPWRLVPVDVAYSALTTSIA